MISPGNIVNHELIGLKVEVVDAKNRTQIGTRGRVVDETMKILKIETERGEKTVEKKNAVFAFTIPSGRRVRVDGAVIAARPEDRIKKKLKMW